MRVDDLQERINEYRCGDPESYRPFRVEVEVTPPLFLTSPWIHLDGVLQYLCLRDCLGEDFYDLPTNYIFSFDEFQLPLQRTGGVYHASVGIYRAPKLKRSMIYKRFEDYMIHYHPKLCRKKYRTNMGHFKDWMVSLPFIVTDEVTFYGCGDMTEVRRLLGHMTHLGKKTVIGGGRIRGLRVEGTDEDYSFYHPEYGVMRPIPSHLKLPGTIRRGSVLMMLPYKPPYWYKGNVTFCIAPKNQLTEEGDV